MALCSLYDRLIPSYSPLSHIQYVLFPLYGPLLPIRCMSPGGKKGKQAKRPLLFRKMFCVTHFVSTLVATWDGILAAKYIECWPCPPFDILLSKYIFSRWLAYWQVGEPSVTMVQGMYSVRPIHWNIKSSSGSPGRSRVGPAL
jgi:hypothetical protein